LNGRLAGRWTVNRAPKTLEAASGIKNGIPVTIRTHLAHRLNMSLQRIDDPNPVAIPRAQYEISMRCRSAESGDVVRVMRKITVHFEDEFVVSLQCPHESRAIRPAKSALCRAVQDMDVGVLGR
jgi:hypothetical protein